MEDIPFRISRVNGENHDGHQLQEGMPDPLQKLLTDR